MNGIIKDSVYIAPGARVIGDVRMGENVSIWFNAVVRADDKIIFIGDNTNVQDNCTLHVPEVGNLYIGEGVSIGHNAIVHGCTIGNNTLIGMGSIIMDRAVIGNNCIVGAGSLVTGGKNFPDNTLIMGSPAKAVRPLTEAEVRNLAHNAELYILEARHYKEMEEEK